MAKFKMLPNGTVIEDLIESQTITPATSYADLSNKPSINSVPLSGNRTSSQLGLMGKDEAYIKEEVDELIANIERGLTYKVVEELPTTGIDTRTIYLVPDEEDEGVMQQYLYISNDWVLLGSTEIDLSDYYTKDEVGSIFATLDEAKLNASTTAAYAGYVMAVNADGDIEPVNKALYNHNVTILIGQASDAVFVRGYINFVTTSPTAIDNKTKLSQALSAYIGGFLPCGGWFITTADKGGLARIGVTEGTIGIGGMSVSGTNVGTFRQLEVTDSYTISDVVKQLI